VKTVIMGCGRVGSALAVQLVGEGHDVVLIDISEYQFTRFLPDGFRGRTIVGNGIDQDVQRKAGIEGADAFVAVTAGDNRNVMAAQIAKHVFGVPSVVVRIYDPIRQEMYEKLGLRTISPTKVVPKLLRDALDAPQPAAAEGGP
jgi:trk system potassium uptake protein TrkA